MKITISIPDELYEKLEHDRGLVPRSTYIQKLVAAADGLEKKYEGHYDHEEEKAVIGKESDWEPKVAWKGSRFKDDKLNK